MLALGGFSASFVLHTMTSLLFKLLIKFSYAMKSFNRVLSHGDKSLSKVRMMWMYVLYLPEKEKTWHKYDVHVRQEETLATWIKVNQPILPETGQKQLVKML